MRRLPVRGTGWPPSPRDENRVRLAAVHPNTSSGSPADRPLPPRPEAGEHVGSNPVH